MSEGKIIEITQDIGKLIKKYYGFQMIVWENDML